MNKVFIIVLLLSNISLAQTNEQFIANFMFESELKTENVLNEYNQFDYSNIWTQTNNTNVLGIIGKEHQRIKIKLISIQKDQKNQNKYFVIGKSNVKGIICDFKGTITLKIIKELKSLHYGVDDEYADKGIKSQGLTISDYEFKEDSKQKHSGVFKGTFYSKWYLNADNEIKYDNIESIADGYTNNAFVGVWKSNTNQKKKICNWADFRVPNAHRDFDIGAGEFAPSEKYHDKGWSDYNTMIVDTWWKQKL